MGGGVEASVAKVDGDHDEFVVDGHASEEHASRVRPHVGSNQCRNRLRSRRPLTGCDGSQPSVTFQNVNYPVIVSGSGSAAKVSSSSVAGLHPNFGGIVALDDVRVDPANDPQSRLVVDLHNQAGHPLAVPASVLAKEQCECVRFHPGSGSGIIAKQA